MSKSVCNTCECECHCGSKCMKHLGTGGAGFEHYCECTQCNCTLTETIEDEDDYLFKGFICQH
jgi:hypothetical protein